MVTERLAELVTAALQMAVADGIVPNGEVTISFERPRKEEHGDWSTNVALALGKEGLNPRAVAQALVERLPASDLLEAVEVAGPGFINFRLSAAWMHDVVRRAADASTPFGRSDQNAGTKVNVEYVSANPTGPVTVVLGRHAAVGDSIARLLEATGHDVTREYYFNDAGRQVIVFASSVAARYMQHLGVDAEFPEDGYQGEYVTELAAEIAGEIGDELVSAPEDERVERIRQLAAPRIIESVRASLERFGTTFDVWFSEATLHQKGEVEAAIEALADKGLIEEREDAKWFRSSELGDDKDRVVIKADGDPTYFAADLGYLLDKERRGFDLLIYIWGADHHGAMARLFAAADALGIGRDRVEIPLIQIVRLKRGGEAVMGSKRSGVVLPLDELVDEVGLDAARYVFLTRSTDAPLDFDIDLAKEQAPENPVYYVQYAHARICSIVGKAAAEGLDVDPQKADLGPLGHSSEERLMRKLAAYEEEVIEAADRRAPQRITRYVEELASDFSAFYRDCKVVSDDRTLSEARLSLCLAARRVIADGLGLLGVSAPERM